MLTSYQYLTFVSLVFCILLQSASTARIPVVGSHLEVSDEGNQSSDEAWFGSQPCSMKTEYGSGRLVSSCIDSWERGGRCAWVLLHSAGAGRCVPNCLHVRNQNAKLCEMPFCQWDHFHQQCTFNNNLTALRRKACDSFGVPERRLVDENGVQTSFYNFLGLSNRQVSFCKGLTGDGDSPDVEESANEEETVLASMMRCWKPRPGEREKYRDAESQKEMLEQLRNFLDPWVNRTQELQFHPFIAYNPLPFLGPLKDYSFVPKHSTIGFTGSFHPETSECLEFDYQNISNSIGDKVGCSFFKGSFQPIQGVQKCIEAEIKDDPYRRIWNSLGSKAGMGGDIDVDDVVNYVLGKVKKSGWNDLFNATTVKQMVEQWRDDAATSAPPFRIKLHVFSDFRRGAEILHQVELDSWEGLYVEGVRSLLERRILSTVTTPFSYNSQSLKNETVKAIIQKCFAIPNEEESKHLGESGTPFKARWKEAFVLKESLRCAPMMWDITEVPALPKRAISPSDGLFEVEKNYSVHPLCGRIAMTPLLRAFARSNYPQNYKLATQTAVIPSRQTCINIRHAQCNELEHCWKKFMRKNVQSLSDACVYQ